MKPYRSYTPQEPAYPQSSGDETTQWRTMPLTELRTKLRAERRRALEGHWTYDPARHRSMLEVFRQRVAIESPATRKSIEEFV